MDDGSVSGTVFEAGGDAAPLAHVTFAGRGNSVEREIVAGEHGDYQATHLAAGAYTVVARSSRTGSSARVAVTVRAGRNVDLPITLSATWTVIEAKGLRALPLEDGNYLEAVRNGSEVTLGEEGGNIEGYTPYSPRGNSAFNSLGQRGQNNNFTVDGFDNNESWLGGAVLQPPVEAIESVELSEVYLPASVGHATGGSLNVTTRSGSRQLHGSVFDYFQNSALDARNFFDGAGKPGLVGNRFGGSLGGPVRKNDWFFFGDSESLRERQGLTVISTVPTAAQKAGDFGAEAIYDPRSFRQLSDGSFTRSLFPDNRIPQSAIPQAAQNLIALYPDPNLPGAADNYRFTPELVQNDDRFSVRSDKILSSRSTLFARFSYERDDTQSPGALPAPAGLPFSVGPYVASDSSQHADDANTNLNAWAGAVSHTFVARPDLINDFRAALARFDLDAQPDDSVFNASALGIPGLGAGGLPAVSPVGFAQLGASEAVPMQMRTGSYEVRDTVAWRTARHTWEFGAQLIRRHVDGSTPEWTSRGTFSFTPDYTALPGVAGTGDSIASLLTGFPSEVMRDVQFNPFQLRGWEVAGFVQDEIRLWRRLTIQAGLRYSLDPPLTEAADRMVNFNYDLSAPALNQFAGQGGVNQYGGLGFDKLTFAPRIGFALNVFGNGATVLRGGFSKDYDTGSYIAEGILAQNPPFASRLDIVNSTFETGSTLADGLPAPEAVSLVDAASLNSAHGAIYAIEPRNYTPYADQWGLFLQQRLRPRLTLEAAGMGSMGIHLYESYDANAPYPAPTPYNYPRYPFEPYDSRIEYLGFAGGSTYYGGQLKLTGQPAADLHLQMTYRYAKSLDDSTQPGTSQESRPSGPQYIYDLRGNRSPSPFDVTQRLVLTASYDLPFKSARAGGNGTSRLLRAALADWRAGTVITAQTGFPFTPELAVNSLNNGGYQLPNRVGNGSLPADQRSYLQWFNTSLDTADPNHAFEIPNLYQYGNSGFDILRGPGLATTDASLSKSFALGERLRLRTRLEAYNLLNRTNFALPNRILGVESSGVIDHTITPARSLQVVARVEW
jgi:hypothetical protein